MINSGDARNVKDIWTFITMKLLIHNIMKKKDFWYKEKLFFFLIWWHVNEISDTDNINEEF